MSDTNINTSDVFLHAPRNDHDNDAKTAQLV
jgi:hypothetical protein